MNKDICKQNNNYNNSLFPLYLNKINLNKSNNLLSCHWHDEIEFVFIHSGDAIFKIENNCFVAHEGDVIIISSGEIHSIYTLNSHKCLCISIMFNIEMLSSKSSDVIQLKFINPLISNQLDLPHHLTCKNSIEQSIKDFLITLISTLDSKELNFELIAKSYLYMIFSKIMLLVTYKNTNQLIDTNNLKTNNIKHILNYIHLNYNRHLTIKELSSELNISECHFCRFFKSFTFKTPIDYINYYRITKAQDLLVNTDKKILDICFDVGFNNLSYFINTFKKNTSYTPSKFRKSFKKI